MSLRTTRQAFLARRHARRHLIAKYRHKAEVTGMLAERMEEFAPLARRVVRIYQRKANYHANMLVIEQKEWDAGYAPPVNRHWKAVTTG